MIQIMIALVVITYGLGGVWWNHKTKDFYGILSFVLLIELYIYVLMA